MGCWVAAVLSAWVHQKRVPTPTVSPIPNDAQINRVLAMVQQGTCDEGMRKKLLDLTTRALPRLSEQIMAHTKAVAQVTPLHDKLPTNETSWSIAQRTVHDRHQRLLARLSKLQNLNIACRQQLDALEAVMIDDALQGQTSHELDQAHYDLMQSIDVVLSDARSQQDAVEEVGQTTGPIDLSRRRTLAQARKPEHS